MAEPTDIVGEDEQLYDWGIENRLDQYYQNAAAAGNNGNPPAYTSGEGYSAHQQTQNHNHFDATTAPDKEQS